jgi:hypothetical protein
MPFFTDRASHRLSAGAVVQNPYFLSAPGRPRFSGFFSERRSRLFHSVSQNACPNQIPSAGLKFGSTIL